MKIPAIKKLVENHTVEDLRQAEEALVEESPMPFEIEGQDEGEQLTHIIAAIWIIEKMEHEQQDFKTALRSYTQMVRESIN